MPELIAKSALWNLAPIVVADLTVTPIEEEEAWVVGIFPGQASAVARVFQAAGGVFPQPLTSQSFGTGRLVWSGRDEAILFGAAPPAGLEGLAALVCQTGALAGLRVSGALGADLLARLVPVDLRDSAMARGGAVRSLWNHLPTLIVKDEAGDFLVYLPRSAAKSGWDELAHAVQSLAARVKFTAPSIVVPQG